MYRKVDLHLSGLKVPNCDLDHALTCIFVSHRSTPASRLRSSFIDGVILREVVTVRGGGSRKPALSAAEGNLHFAQDHSTSTA